MKKLMRKIFTFILSLSFATTAVFASDASMAEEEAGPISYNVGFASEYWYRGVYQSESSVSFGADYETSNFYAGTWWADVDQGVEYDIYAGYGFSIGGADLYIGATGYYYSDNFFLFIDSTLKRLILVPFVFFFFLFTILIFH